MSTPQIVDIGTGTDGWALRTFKDSNMLEIRDGVSAVPKYMIPIATDTKENVMTANFTSDQARYPILWFSNLFARGFGTMGTDNAEQTPVFYAVSGVVPESIKPTNGTWLLNATQTTTPGQLPNTFAVNVTTYFLREATGTEVAAGTGKGYANDYTLPPGGGASSGGPAMAIGLGVLLIGGLLMLTKKM